MAEGCSFYNVATTSELWAAIEVALDAMAMLPIAPAAALLLRRGAGTSPGSSAFLWICAVAIPIYFLYNFLIDVPMYLRRYEADQVPAAARKNHPARRRRRDPF